MVFGKRRTTMEDGAPNGRIGDRKVVANGVLAAAVPRFQLSLAVIDGSSDDQSLL